jgi:hypothetical protein
MTPSLERRLRQWRARTLVRAWQYRQRRHAQGVWFRLRRALADASAAYVLPREEADRLVAEGHRVEPVGAELEPPKLILIVPRARLARIESARPIPLRLGAELFAAERLALTPFEEEASSASRSAGEAAPAQGQVHPSHGAVAQRGQRHRISQSSTTRSDGYPRGSKSSTSRASHPTRRNSSSMVRDE